MSDIRKKYMERIELLKFFQRQGYTIHTSVHMILPDYTDYFDIITDEELMMFFAEGYRLRVNMEEKFLSLYY